MKNLKSNLLLLSLVVGCMSCEVQLTISGKSLKQRKNELKQQELPLTGNASLLLSEPPQVSKPSQLTANLTPWNGVKREQKKVDNEYKQAIGIDPRFKQKPQFDTLGVIYRSDGWEYVFKVRREPPKN